MKKITLLFAFLLAFASQGYSQFSESFEAGIPPSWTVINNGDVNTWESLPPNFPTNAHSGLNVARINYSFDSHDDYLITAQFTVTTGLSDRLTVWARNYVSSYPETFDILLSTTGVNSADFTTTIASTVTPPDQTWQKFTYSLSAYVGQTVYIAFHSTTTNMYELYLDDIMIDTPPTTPPNCITNPVSSINPACGNFASTISWDTVPNVDGYYLTIGTTSGGTDILNNQDLGLVTNYVINIQSPNTTYYWNVVPYNLVGSAIGCIANNYTTVSVSCYCTPNPQSVDDLGITNVSIGTINNATGVETGNYGNYSSMVTNVYQGLSMPFSITYETGYTYDTKIWVDWNNDYDFDDAGEEVYAGVSDYINPTTLTGSIMIPATATLGSHRMRIGGQDSGPVTSCYDGYYGSFEDYSINVAVASCSPPAALTAVTFDCGSNQFFVQVNVTNLGSGTPSITDSVSTWPVTAIGNVQAGPFSFGNPVTLTLQHGSNAICNIPLGTINYAGCPPTNDNCANAIILTPGTVYSTNLIDGTNLAATTSLETGTTCNGFFGGDVWYSLIVPASGSVTIETGDTSVGGASFFDSVISIYSGVCGSLTQVDCDDDSADTGGYSLKTLTGQTPGTTLYVRVFEYYNDTIADFGISAYDASLSTTLFDNTGLSVYPNPVKDVLNLSYTSTISKITILNLLGQEVFKKNINATQSQIDISSLANGSYLVKIETGDLLKTVKIVKSN